MSNYIWHAEYHCGCKVRGVLNAEKPSLNCPMHGDDFREMDKIRCSSYKPGVIVISETLDLEPELEAIFWRGYDDAQEGTFRPGSFITEKSNAAWVLGYSAALKEKARCEMDLTVRTEGHDSIAELRKAGLTERELRIAMVYAANIAWRAYVKAGGCTHCKSYDPLSFDSDNKAHSYVLNLTTGGRHHPFKSLEQLERAMLEDITKWFQEKLPEPLVRPRVTLKELDTGTVTPVWNGNYCGHHEKGKCPYGDHDDDEPTCYRYAGRRLERADPDGWSGLRCKECLENENENREKA